MYTVDLLEESGFGPETFGCETKTLLAGSFLVPRLGWKRFAFRPRDVNGFFSTERRGLILVPRSFRTFRFTLGSDVFLLRAQQIKRSSCVVSDSVRVLNRQRNYGEAYICLPVRNYVGLF
ncbi:hypothetical protein AVEN_52128-1 [Araneus ventricosus]|uniref:Uncharacterized protein n=1 Tax=Araneus ventricosus TaxID=182803 RepID=A0A4Y2E6F8_ARAVE|nr:hypothetical protein AVEN_52128-1 [Araneus ventricosus]